VQDLGVRLESWEGTKSCPDGNTNASRSDCEVWGEGLGSKGSELGFRLKGFTCQT